MKITPTLRAILVAMCLCMVFSLFACAEDTTTITDSPATDAPTEEKTEAPTSEKTEAPTDEPTETEEPTEAPCAHEEVVLEGKAATCTEAGLTEGKKCSKCDEILVPQEEIPATGHTEVTLDAVAPTCQATGLTEGKKCSVCEAVLTAQETVAIDPNAHNMDNGTPAEAAKCGDKATVTYKCQNEGCTHTNVVEGEVLAHDMDEGTVTTAPTCTEKGVKTFKCKREGCDHETTEEVAALGHTEETVAGKAATCTATGLTDGKKCSVCGVTTVEQNEIPVVAHTEATLDAVSPTCTATGLTEGKKCSVCETVIKAQETVAALGHAQVDVAYIAPTTAEVGYVAHKGCSRCDAVWTAEGEEITDGSHVIPKIVPTTNYYFGYEELKGKKIHSANQTTGCPHKVTPAEDRTYVRFERTGKGSDGALYFIDLPEITDKVSGKYFVMKYRSNEPSIGGFGKTTAGSLSGPDVLSVYFNGNGEWKLMIMDLSNAGSSIVKNDNGEYCIRVLRLDILDAEKDSGYFDIAYAVITSDLSKVVDVMQEGDTALCTHAAGDNPAWENKGDYHAVGCAICHGEIKADHVTNAYTYNEAEGLYTGDCACGGKISREMLYMSESYVGDGAAGSGGKVTAERKTEGTTDFVRYTPKSNNDPYFLIYNGGTAVTGRYLVIRYRLVNNNTNMTMSRVFAASLASGKSGPAEPNIGNKGTFIGDGEWHYLVVTLPEEKMTAATDKVPSINLFQNNEDGTFSLRFLRMGYSFAAMDGSCYLDIDHIAFADKLEAAEKYAYKDEKNPAVKIYLESSNSTVNGVAVTGSDNQSTETIQIDLKDTSLESATSLKLGGWIVTRGGVASYGYRIVEVDGVAVENPVLNPWLAGCRDRSDMYTEAGLGKTMGYAEWCQIKAGFNSNAFDLTEYAGKTVKIEAVAITNFGAEIVMVEVSNVSVPAATAE